ncbi:MAG TPA: methyltransferase domain-containing protein [Steroidobacteraceae bacterium]|nr:methyltransferase domain-containing protein [Steroidobacteraceae bacterium]
MNNTIRFDNGAAYERYMGHWSQLVGEEFLGWLAPAPGLRWLDVGCGNGAFTELIAARCTPAALTGVDPSEAQLAFARSRPALQGARFEPADAMALPLADDSVDLAVMPLVLFFVPEPARGVAEMARVVAPGGTVAAYSWDMEGGGFPYAVLRAELERLGARTPGAPSDDASRLDVSQRLWRSAGLQAIETRRITVQRTFADFDEYWKIIEGGPSVGATLKALSARDAALLQERLKLRLPADGAGRITYSSTANAVRGRVPG